MAKISEREFSKICRDISRERDSIIKHNPIGTDEVILLWMLLSVLHSYLSLSEAETPCFTGTPTAKMYREAIAFVLKDKKSEDFDETPYIQSLA